MINFFTLKNGRVNHIQRTGSAETLCATWAPDPISIAHQAGKPNLWMAGLRYETTKNDDNNLNYDKRFKPADPSFVSHKGANHSRKAILDEEP